MRGSIDLLCNMEAELLEYTTYKNLYDYISTWLDTDTMCEILHDYAQDEDFTFSFEESEDE